MITIVFRHVRPAMDMGRFVNKLVADSFSKLSFRLVLLVRVRGVSLPRPVRFVMEKGVNRRKIMLV
jgi:hypothetical protein